MALEKKREALSPSQPADGQKSPKRHRGLLPPPFKAGERLLLASEERKGGVPPFRPPFKAYSFPESSLPLPTLLQEAAAGADSATHFLQKALKKCVPYSKPGATKTTRATTRPSPRVFRGAIHIADGKLSGVGDQHKTRVFRGAKGGASPGASPGPLVEVSPVFARFVP